ncbi:MAG TPA: rhomboid family intramembrane serine protease [Gaiellaceae bacterium]|nr:rhomboid family intramembrane serine protease [Gaiellaceae bacterium]
MEPAPRYCYRHPDRETGLSCSECGRPICYECMTPAAVGLRCPEHSGKPQGIQKVTVAAERAVTGVGARRANLVTMILIGINVAVYAAELALGGTTDGLGNTLYNHGVLFANGAYDSGQLLTGPVHAVGPVGSTPAGVEHGEWWRLITTAFLHYGPLHLGLNMFSLYFAGSILEQVIGRWRFVLLYLAAGVAGSAGALLVTPNQPTAGASGAIFGVLGALLILERRGHIGTGGQVLLMIILNLVFTFAVPGISIGGHIGGLIAGLIVMLSFLRFRHSWQASVGTAALVTAIAVIVAYSTVN